MSNRRVVLAFYFLLGVVMEFPVLALRWWLMETLELDIPAIAVVVSTASLPWTIKPLYGLISDQYPLCGRRRKPYIVLCNLTAAALWCVLAMRPAEVQGTVWLVVMIQAATCFADVLYDASMVELSQTEDGADAGSFQSSCWAARAAGAVVAAIGGGAAAHWLPKHTVFLVQAVFPSALALLACLAFEDPPSRVDPTGCAVPRRVVAALRDGRLWKPALFVCAFAATPSSGTAWFYYLVNDRGFDPSTMGWLTCVRHVSMFLAALAYRRWCRLRAFRSYFAVVVVASSVLSLSPLLLINGVNQVLGLPDVLFVGGDDVFLAAMGQVAMMPCLVLAAKLCPQGIEASLYATFVGLMNAASIGSEYLGASLTAAVGVSHDNFDALPRLVVLCSVSSLLPLLFLCFLPSGNASSIATVRDDDEAELPLRGGEALGERSEVALRAVGPLREGHALAVLEQDLAQRGT